MKVSRELLSIIMKSAWYLARQGASRFGGRSRDYFRSALTISWAEQRTRVIVNRKKGTSRFWMPGVPVMNRRHTVSQLSLEV